MVFMPEVGAAVVGGTITEVGRFALNQFGNRMRLRSANRLWAPLLTQHIDIVMSEFSNAPAAADPQVKLVRNIGVNHLISKGVAHAVAVTISFLAKEFRKYDCTSHGDKTIRHDLKDNLLLIGSPVTNKYSASVFRSLADSMDLGFEIKHDESTIQIVDTASGNVYEPHFDGDSGTDYALVIRAQISKVPPRWCLMLCGASMWGVEGAAEVVTSPRGLKRISRYLAPENNVAFLVRVAIINMGAQNPEILPLDKNRREYVRVLKPRATSAVLREARAAHP
ncbi:MAG TPA: hypothetical protein VMU01_10585 [Rhizomicrobium sp.]|nr:hypothetical protein [Rhizomicrobium sp.]